MQQKTLIDFGFWSTSSNHELESEQKAYEPDEKERSDLEEDLPTDWHPEYRIEPQLLSTSHQIGSRAGNTSEKSKRQRIRRRKSTKNIKERQQSMFAFLDLTTSSKSREEPESVEYLPLRMVQ